MTAGADWLAAQPDGLRLWLRVTPRAGQSRVEGVRIDATGQPRLAVRVKAPAEGGKANAELIRLLARRWRLPASDLVLKSGHGARHKVLLVRGNAAELATRLRMIEQASQTGQKGKGEARRA